MKRKVMFYFVAFLAVFSGMSTLASLKIPAIFSDNMVLQRQQRVAVWGWTQAGDEVTVKFAGQSKSAKAGADGKFTVYLEALEASSEPRVLSFTSGGEKVAIKNVMVGEVWLCSGQSNMQMNVGGAKDLPQVRAEADKYPQIRMFLTDAQAVNKPQVDCTGSWKVCSAATVPGFSATAYFFGRKIHQDLQIPVGLIRSSWGGTGVEAWSPMESLLKYPTVMQYKATMDNRAKTFNEAEAEQNYQKQRAAWKVKQQKAQAKGQKIPRAPRKAVHPHVDQNYPANLFNGMINPLVPYGIRGAIWYQGEHNAGTCERAVLYRDLLENMVTEWRKCWQSEFPFYAVQLVNFRAPQKQPVEETGWAAIRESFLKFHKEVPNAGIAVGIDVGEVEDIHPKNKQAIGLRLAHQALAKTYKLNVVPGGPIYKGMQVQGDQVVLSFDDIGSGLKAEGGELKRFAIAGSDKKFVEAQAVIKDDKVVVSSPLVKKPAAVRYAWANNPEGCNLYNKEGFPASPFRTDAWPYTAP